jgi:hypothetical protein
MTPDDTPGSTAARRALQIAMAMALALAGLLPSAGCSYLFMTPAPPNHARLPHVECTSSRVAPTIDAVIASIYTASAVGVLVSTVSQDAPHTDWAALGGSAGIAVAAGASAVTGFGSATRCEAAVTAWQTRGGIPLPPPCGRDIDCQGERICEAGLCVAPLSTSAALRLGAR